LQQLLTQLHHSLLADLSSNTAILLLLLLLLLKVWPLPLLLLLITWPLPLLRLRAAVRPCWHAVARLRPHTISIRDVAIGATALLYPTASIT
jgi:hypothetical protein